MNKLVNIERNSFTNTIMTLSNPVNLKAKHQRIRKTITLAIKNIERKPILI